MLSNVLFILLGAGLVSIGFLVAALAERLRDHRAPRDPDIPRGTPSRAQERHPVPTTAVPVEGPPVRTPHVPRPAPSPGGEGDVIAALVAAGYKKPVATEATRACAGAERATIEGWTVAALRRCAGVS